MKALAEGLRAQLGTVTGLLEPFAVAVQAVGRKGIDRWKIPLSRGWRVRNTLHGSGTGRFLREVRRRADASGDSRLMAYADGAVIAYAAALCGNSFINGIVGGPYRNHWWRNRWVSNYVDTWVWGYVEKRRKVRLTGDEIVFNLQGRVPTPTLPTWDNLCGAELQKRIAIGGITETVVLNAIGSRTPLPAHLPAELIRLWLGSYRATYGTPPAGMSDGIDGAAVQSAYALTWLNLWLGTSAGFLGCIPPDQVNLPDGCGSRPDWVAVDGSVVLPGGSVVAPPNPPMGSPSWAEVASAIALAILAGINYAVGNIAGGTALIAASVALLDDATPPDWDKLSCHAEWLAVYLTNLENALRELLVAAGLGYPYTVQLAHNEIQFSPMSGGQVVPPTAALNTCRSVSSLQNVYPRSFWSPSPAQLSNWTQYPTEPAEDPGQRSYHQLLAWPLDFVDGMVFTPAPGGFSSSQTNPVRMSGPTPTVISHEEWEQRSSQLATDDTVGGPFGNAVDVAGLLLSTDANAYLDWDLDNDRGIGWPTWFWDNPSVPPGHVQRES